MDSEKAKSTAYYSMGPAARDLEKFPGEESTKAIIKRHLDEYRKTGKWESISCAEAYLTAFGL